VRIFPPNQLNILKSLFSHQIGERERECIPFTITVVIFGGRDRNARVLRVIACRLHHQNTPAEAPQHVGAGEKVCQASSSLTIFRTRLPQMVKNKAGRLWRLGHFSMEFPRTQAQKKAGQ
jgi:hypothetical protein